MSDEKTILFVGGPGDGKVSVIHRGTDRIHYRSPIDMPDGTPRNEAYRIYSDQPGWEHIYLHEDTYKGREPQVLYHKSRYSLYETDNRWVKSDDTYVVRRMMGFLTEQIPLDTIGMFRYITEINHATHTITYTVFWISPGFA